MTFKIDVNKIGCGQKFDQKSISYSATQSKLPENLDAHNIRFGDRGLLVSIDRIGRFCSDVDLFGEIASSHIIGDVIAAGGTPFSISFCIEAGPEIRSKKNIAEITSSLVRFCKVRDISLGNFHTVRSDYTAVTGCVIGTPTKQERMEAVSGFVYISRPIGAYKCLVLNETLKDSAVDTNEIFSTKVVRNIGKFTFGATDITGFGLCGSLESLSRRYGLDIQATLTTCLAISDDVYKIPLRCIDANGYDYMFRNGLAPELRAIAVCSEVAGPFVMLCEESEEIKFEKEFYNNNGFFPIKCGRYKTATAARVIIN